MNAAEGLPFSGLVATFLAADAALTAGDFAASIDWGDAQTSSGTVTANGSGGFDVTGDHTYPSAGTYAVDVTVTSTPTGDAATAHSTAQVLSSLAVENATVTAAEGQPFSGNVATFVSVNAGRTAGDFTASIDWGDGSATTAGSISANGQGGFDVSGSHTYPEAGAYPISVTITDTITGKSTSSPGGWQPAAAMSTARYLFAAATGGDGRIYAFGGYGSSGLLASAEAYDPATNVWNPIAGMPQARIYFAAAAGGDGRLYVLGGYNGLGSGVLPTVSVYDPTSHTWNASPVANMPAGRAGSLRPRGPTGGSMSLAGTATTTSSSCRPASMTPAATSGLRWPTCPADASISRRQRAPMAASMCSVGTTRLSTSPRPWTSTIRRPMPGRRWPACRRPELISALLPDPPDRSMRWGAMIPMWDTSTPSTPWTQRPTPGFRCHPCLWGELTWRLEQQPTVAIYALGGYGSNFQVNSSVEALSGVALVIDPDLQAFGVPVEATEGIAFTALVASFRDDDPIGNFAAEIDWGDGVTSAGTIVANGNDGFDVSGGHTYDVPGTFGVTVIIRDGNAISTGATSTRRRPSFAEGRRDRGPGHSRGRVQRAGGHLYGRCHRPAGRLHGDHRLG